MKKEKFEIELEYTPDGSKPPYSFSGGPKRPEILEKELHVSIAERKLDELNAKYLISLGGSKEALYELGKFLICLSRYQTVDENFHEHFDKLPSIDAAEKNLCDLIIRGPTTFEKYR